MQQILNETKVNKCIYCNQSTYGKGCPYSPHRVHVHLSDPQKCIYCGSTTIGSGCPYNPYGKNHIRGIEFNLMMKESLHKSITAGIFLTRLTEPIKESKAYLFGLIDESGKRLKLPETLEEKQAFTPLDAYILRLRRIIGESKFDLLNSSTIISLLSKPLEENFDSKKYETEVKLQNRVKNLIKEYKEIIFESSQNNIPLERIENTFIEEIISSNE